MTEEDRRTRTQAELKDRHAERLKEMMESQEERELLTPQELISRLRGRS